MDDARRRPKGKGSAMGSSSKHSRSLSRSSNQPMSIDHSITKEALTQSQILEQIASLTQLLAPGRTRDRANEIMGRGGHGCKPTKKSGVSKRKLSDASSSGCRRINLALEDEPVEDAEEEEYELSARSVVMKRLSKSKTCVCDGGAIHMDKEGKKFMDAAKEYMKYHCYDVHQKWTGVKKSHKDRVIAELKEHFGVGFSRGHVLKRLAKKWNGYRSYLRRQVREDPRMSKPDEVSQEAWDLFVEDSKKVYEKNIRAAAAREGKQITGSGGDDYIKTQFFMHFCGYPTDIELENIKKAGRFQKWIKDQETCGKQYNARDFVGKGATKPIFKRKNISEKVNEASDVKEDQEEESEDQEEESDHVNVLEDEVDIVGLHDEEEEDKTDNTGSSDSDGTSSTESTSASGSSSSENEAEKSFTPPRKKKTCGDIAREIYLRRGEPEPSK